MPVSLEASLRLVTLAIAPCVACYGELETALAIVGFTDEQFVTLRGQLQCGTAPLSAGITPDGLLREIAYLVHLVTHCVYRSLGLLRAKREALSELPAEEQDLAINAFLADLQREFRVTGVYRAIPELYNPTPSGEDSAPRTERLRRLFEAENLEVRSPAVKPIFDVNMLLLSASLSTIAWAGSYVVFETMGPAISLCAYSLFQALHMVSLPHVRTAQAAVRGSAQNADARIDGEPHSFMCGRLAEAYADAQGLHRDNDGGERNLLRLRNRAMMLAMVSVDFLITLDGLVPGTPLTYELQATAGDILEYLLSLVPLGLENRRPFVAQALGALLPDGGKPAHQGTSSPSQHNKADASSGHRFILEQLKLKESAYHMPALSASQQKWEQWFEKLVQLLDHFQLSEAGIIHYVTGHLESTHQLMVGWQAVVSECKRSDGAVTLQQFFAHVRKRLFVSASTRQEAHLSFLALCKKPTTCVDGKALCVELQTLFARLFPDPATGRAELEPITWYNACLKVQEMLVSLHQTPLNQRKSVLVKAWTAYDFNATVIYREFLVRSKHSDSSEASAVLCKGYLQRVYEQLTEAHEMHVTVHRGVEGESQQVLSLAAEQLGLPSGQHLARAVSASRTQKGQPSGPKRGRTGPEDADRQSAQTVEPATVQAAAVQPARPNKKQKRSGSAPRSASTAPPSAVRPGPVAPSQAPKSVPAARLSRRSGLSDEGYLREANTPERYALVGFCSANGITTSQEQCLELARAGKCVLCGYPMHVSVLDCSRCVDKRATKAHLERRRTWHNKVRRYGLEQAALSEGTPMRVHQVPPRSS